MENEEQYTEPSHNHLLWNPGYCHLIEAETQINIESTSNVFSEERIIIEVCSSGFYQFSNIQDAINFAPASGATIIVRPGTYYGTIRIDRKSLTLQSLYATTQDPSYITNTRLIAQYPEIVLLVGSELINAPGYPDITVNIDGFTISNNLQGVDYVPPEEAIRPGLLMSSSNGTIRNNIFTNNFNSTRGGAIHLTTSLRSSKNIYLENNKIFNNEAFYSGGGLYVGEYVKVIFSQELRNDIYNNRATSGQDIAIYGSYTTDTDIFLNKGSRIMTSPDFQFIGYSNNILVDIHHATLPLIDADLYVSPWGCDSNSGLSPSDPLNTIYYASSIIASNPSKPNSIFLEAGIYSRENGQHFPIFLPAWTRLIGAGIGETILEDGFRNTLIYYHNIHWNGEVEMKDFTIRNSGSHRNRSSRYIVRGYAKTHKISNIEVYNTSDAYVFYLYGGYRSDEFFRDSRLYFTNVSLKNARGSLITTRFIDCVMIENVFVDNVIEGSRRAPIHPNIYNTRNIYLNNMSITNCFAQADGTIFSLVLINNLDEIYEFPNVLNNILITNNVTYDPSPPHSGPERALVRIAAHGLIPSLNVNNMTIANNRGAHTALQTAGYPRPIFNNIVLYNPDLIAEFSTSNTIPYVNNSIIYQNRLAFNPNLTKENVIYDNPQFLGNHNDKLQPNMWEYYYLHHSSPARDMGIDVSSMLTSNYDLAGNPRIVGNSIDLGPFEFQEAKIDFTANPRSGIVPLEVQFICLNEDAFSWFWDFTGDGTYISYEQNPVFTFGEIGKYTVSLTVNAEETITKTDFIDVQQPVSGTDIVDPPELTYLYPAFPNPFNPSTTIRFSITQDSPIVIEIYNIRGQKIKTLVNEFYQKGNYSVVWFGHDDNNQKVSSGIYLYRMSTTNYTSVRRMLLLK
jgi:PKD repeat protein